MFPRPSSVAALMFAAPVLATAASAALVTAALGGGAGAARAESVKPAAPAPDAPFRAIEGGELRLADYRGGPVLLVNTASMCGYTYQYEGLQALWETYRDRGLTVLAVPSDSFNQEYADSGEVKDFCETNFGITLPMTDVTPVKGAEAHEVYRWLKAEHGFAPRWNFNKVLLDADGAFVAAWGSGAKPRGAEITGAIEAVLGSRS